MQENSRIYFIQNIMMGENEGNFHEMATKAKLYKRTSNNTCDTALWGEQ